MNKIKDNYRNIFLIIVGMSFILWLMTLFYEGVYSEQFNVFFSRTSDLFADFTNVAGYSSERNVYLNPINGAGQKGYPPLPYIIAYAFSRIALFDVSSFTSIYTQKQFLIIFIIFLSVLLSIIHWLISEELRGSKLYRLFTGILITFSLGVVFTIERGNYLLLTLLFCIIYIFWHDNESKILREIALISLALAAAFKITPAILGILLLYEKRFKDAFKAAFYGIVLFFIPFLFFKGGFDNISVMLFNMNQFFAAYSDLEGLGLKAISYQIILYFNSNFYWPSILDTPFRILSILSSLVFLMSAWKFERKWERTLAISLIILLIPKISHVYNIIYLIPSVVLFLNDENRRTSDFVYLLAFIIMSSVFYIQGINNYIISFTILYLATLVKSLPLIYKTSQKLYKKYLNN